MSAVDELLERNRHFVSTSFPGPLVLLPKLGTTIIGCLDPRVDPGVILGLQLGDAPVIRNVGGRVTPAVLQILDLLALGFPTSLGADREGAKGDLIVLHHTQCGITRMQGHPAELAASFGIGVDELPAKAVADPHAAVRVDVDVLRDHPRIADAYRVTGLVYDIETGLVSVAGDPV